MKSLKIHVTSSVLLQSERATRLSRAVAQGAITEQEVSLLLADMKEALAEARLVRDDVLEKAYAGLSIPFARSFQRGL